jgi:hypothetical protein
MMVVFVRLEVFRAVTVKKEVCWVVTYCSSEPLRGNAGCVVGKSPAIKEVEYRK